MGFLHKLWDDTLAGPAPDKVLRKYDSFSAVRSPPTVTIPPHDHIAVTRSITILRAPSVDSGSLPSSPVAGSSTTTSPFSRKLILSVSSSCLYEIRGLGGMFRNFIGCFC